MKKATTEYRITDANDNVVGGYKTRDDVEMDGDVVVIKGARYDLCSTSKLMNHTVMVVKIKM